MRTTMTARVTRVLPGERVIVDLPGIGPQAAWCAAPVPVGAQVQVRLERGEWRVAGR